MEVICHREEPWGWQGREPEVNRVHAVSSGWGSRDWAPWGGIEGYARVAIDGAIVAPVGQFSET